MNWNCNIPWTCAYPYGPIWYLINFPVLLYGWTLPYQIEVCCMIGLTCFVLAVKNHLKMGLFFIVISILFWQSGQPYLISSLSLLALGIIHPAFTVLAIFDRLPLFTSWDFNHSGTWTERTHIERYILFGVWWISEIMYWGKKYDISNYIRKRQK